MLVREASARRFRSIVITDAILSRSVLPAYCGIHRRFISGADRGNKELPHWTGGKEFVSNPEITKTLQKTRCAYGREEIVGTAFTENFSAA